MGERYRITPIHARIINCIRNNGALNDIQIRDINELKQCVEYKRNQYDSEDELVRFLMVEQKLSLWPYTTDRGAQKNNDRYNNILLRSWIISNSDLYMPNLVKHFFLKDVISYIEQYREDPYFEATWWQQVCEITEMERIMKESEDIFLLMDILPYDEYLKACEKGETARWNFSFKCSAVRDVLTEAMFRRIDQVFGLVSLIWDPFWDMDEESDRE